MNSEKIKEALLSIPQTWMLFFMVLVSGNVFAQTAPTYIDWVKSNQTYLQIKVGVDGVYRLPAALIGQHFENLSGLNASGFQIFRRGRELHILVNSGNDNFLNDNDYIDFVGQINDGSGELEMYQKPISAVNNYRSIYDDTAHYFLTYTVSLNGKRVVNNGLNNNSSVPFDPYCWRVASRFNKDQYFMGKGLKGNLTYASYFTPGEGWIGREYSSEPDGGGYSNVVGSGDALYNPVSGISNLYVGGPDPSLELLQIGRRELNHKVEVILSSNLISLDTFRFSGVGGRTFKRNFPITLIENGELKLWAASRGKSNLALAYALVRYPATFQMPNGFNSLEINLTENSSNYSRIKLENIARVPEIYDVTDAFSPVRIGVEFIAGSYVAGIENTNISRKLIIQNRVNILRNDLTRKVLFTPINPFEYDYIIVSHPKLRKPALGYADPVKAYADFRKSPAGGNYKVLLIEIDEVYQRFGYGDRLPLAIRNLGGFFVQKNVKIKGMFLLGKGLTVKQRYNPSYFDQNLVPTFGVPASDNAFALGLGESGRTMAFPVGRLAAKTPGQVAVYLNKVKETEAFAYDDLWKKNVFHISGGLSPLEQTAFTYIMRQNLGSVVSNKYFGAKVEHFNKSSNAAVEFINIKKILNSGISLLTLFGHSSQTSPDVEIGYASDPSQGFNNQGRYPMVIINGCYAGDMYDFNESLNENWVLTPNKGAIMFLASSDEGFSALLSRHISHFYNVAFTDSALFGSSFGEIQKETMKRYMSSLNDPQLDSAFTQQFNLHGDPVLKVFGGYKPDYKTSNQEVYLTQTNANANSPNLKLAAIVSNFGRFNRDSLSVRVARRYGDGTSSSFTYRMKPISYKDTLYFDLPQLESFNYSGNNRIEVFLDFQNNEDELNEGNNIGVLEFFLPATGILPLFPKNFAIVPSRNVKLIVQATDFFSPGRRYIFQIDTSASFNSSSPFFAQSPAIVAGNLCTWSYTLPIDRDSTVFFWRVKFADQTSLNDTTWYRQSFEYIKNSPSGWAQSQFYQFKGSQDYGVVKNYVNRQWEFPLTSVLIEVQCSGGGKQSPKQYNIALDGVPLLKARLNTSDCAKGNSRVCAVTLDRCSLKPKFKNMFTPELYFFSLCGREPAVVNYFEFGVGLPTFKAYFQYYINEFVQEGDYVVIFPVDTIFLPIDTFTKYLAAVGPIIGVDPASIYKIKAGDPFIFIGKKTATPSPGMATVVLPTQNDAIRPSNQVLNVAKTVTTNCSFGEILSTKIGPASAWFKLFSRIGNTEVPKSDDFHLQLLGITLNGEVKVLVKDVPSFPFDLSSINADTFPYLQLRARVSDTLNFTPASIKRWMVTYDGVPEGVINTSIFPSNEYIRSEVQEGDSLGFKYAFTNISNKAFKDSVIVRFTLNGNQKSEQNLGLIPPDSTVQFNYPKFSTLGKAGSNQILTFVNPRLQAEEYYDNNVINVPFKVNGDLVQPVLDVTFDGVKIMNGDFISPTPLVAISIKDENKYLIKGDTNGITMLITRPCLGCKAERIPLNSPLVKVFPAGKDNLFRIEYRPEKLENGNYRIAVQGTDVKGNESGSNSYQVGFQVLDQKTITNFFPYPNPFSTSCQWVFTLTGDFPDDFKIQIMTVTGKVVREIMKAELGPLRIGNNISQYRWDATDEYGDRLANGVYLYRVVMKDPAIFANRETAADKAFTKGFGKLYIIR